MLNNVIDSIFSTTSTLTAGGFIVCLLVSLALGVLIAVCSRYRNRPSKSLSVSLVLLPMIVQTIIALVNGQLGAGIAVAGAFSLVRFRSVPGTAKEICALFLAMGAGLIAGMGYLGFAALFTIAMCAMFVIYNRVDFGYKKNAATYKTFTITIPEDLDYSEIFDDIFGEYTTSHDLVRVKTTNMGSMFRLTYNVMLRDVRREKEMIDKLRCRNGNLEITVSKQETSVSEL